MEAFEGQQPEELQEEVTLTPEEAARQAELDALKKWYVLHTYSGYEDKVSEDLMLRSKSMGMEENIFATYVPEEEYTVEKDGVKKVKKRKIFPGYVLVQMIMSDEAWYVVRNTPNVTGFVGSHGAGSKPSPLLPEEEERLLRFQDGTVNTRARDIDLEIGEEVTINSGVFEGRTGVVQETEPEKGRVHLLVDGLMKVELDYDDVSKRYY